MGTRHYDRGLRIRRLLGGNLYILASTFLGPTDNLSLKPAPINVKAPLADIEKVVEHLPCAVQGTGVTDPQRSNHSLRESRLVGTLTEVVDR